MTVFPESASLTILGRFVAFQEVLIQGRVDDVLTRDADSVGLSSQLPGAVVGQSDGSMFLVLPFRGWLHPRITRVELLRGSPIRLATLLHWFPTGGVGGGVT